MKKTSLLIAIFLLVNQLVYAQSVTLATTTANPTKGTVVYNNSTNQLQYWNGSAWIPVTNAASGTGWAQSGNNIYKSNTGSVGIGVTNPANLLQINSIGSTGYSGNQFAIGNGTHAMGISQTDTLTSLKSSTNIALMPQNGEYGNVGINVAKPYNRLQIGSVGSTYLYGYDLVIGNGTSAAAFYQSSTAFNLYSSTKIVLKPNGDGSLSISDGVVSTTGNRVGISTSTPRGPLDVKGSTNSGNVKMAFYREYNAQPVTGGSNSANASISIYAQESVLGSQFIAVSDARIKNIVGISNQIKDLETVKSLQITDYTLKDHLQYGNKSFKKVIAQQVEEVYPQAITKITDVVPDIYTMTETVVFDHENKTLICTLAKSYDVKVGEKLQFVHPSEGIIKAEIIEVSGNSFTVKDWQYPTDKIFVYGREVNDFRSVDYEAISMLGISAIQQLAKENEELKAKLEQVKSDFSARLEAIEAQLPKIPTVK
ncbi:tail fiber domain-containing protein [Emticicia sp. C21]|uniref:tail fiber domain-containing protein n=1 Tax=Emticicia sp. C21 TaxID=2302915 RepID=UPI000E3490EE|nr:tail fiber domain-containing protein [Emticicia sp. C21]RFS16888.1 tail fiber domain-containing protein [Emticicia sp. C21]